MTSPLVPYDVDMEDIVREDDERRYNDDDFVRCEACPAGRAGNFYCLQYEECPPAGMVFPCSNCDEAEDPCCQVHWSYCPHKLGGDAV